MKIEWSRFAVQDRAAIFEHFEAENPLAAVKTDERIAASVERLRTFPERGRTGRVPGTRELVTYPYILAYRVGPDAVRILRVLHGAQQWPDAMPE